MKKDRKFTMPELMNILKNVVGKTLGEADVNGVFKRTINNPKITGIAGDVIEQSVLGIYADSKSEPDIDVDGELIEVKTTGIRKSKKDKNEFEAKEPVSVTAVSPDTIVTETFYESRFWHKIRKLLFVYYEYASTQTVSAADYADFLIKGFDLYEFRKSDRRILKADWELVQKFLIDLRANPTFEEDDYARLSYELRDKLLYIDTAPKWPHPPRFRLKRSLVTQIVQEHFQKLHLEETTQEITGMDSLEDICHELTNKYSGRTVKYLANLFNVSDDNKSVTEKIVVRMFGGKSSKINSLDIFRKAGIYGKTIIFSNKDRRTEDTKLFTINFDEWLNPETSFEDSQIYDYFANNKLLCIEFKETTPGDLLNSQFIGFKLLSFDDTFINKYAKRIWDLVRETIFSGNLKESICYRKDGKPIINRCGTTKSEINFPKSSDNMKLFLRGTGQDSTYKTLNLCGIQMYQQQVWIRGVDIIEMLKEKDLL